jgi:hypothetical protein
MNRLANHVESAASFVVAVYKNGGHLCPVTVLDSHAT